MVSAFVLLGYHKKTSTKLKLFSMLNIMYLLTSHFIFFRILFKIINPFKDILIFDFKIYQL